MTQSTMVITDPRRLRLVLIVVSLALMMTVSAVSGLNVALPDLARDTGASQSEMQWIVDAYTVTLAGLLLISGAIGDRYGRRRLLMVGLVIFGVAAGCALATSNASTLIVLRAVMGVGAALVMPTTLSIITTSFPEERRGKAVGLWVGFFSAGGVLGLLVSGLLLEFFSWSSFFALNVALAVIALIGTIAVIPNSVDESPPAIDLLGALLSLLTIGGLVFGFIEGPDNGWTSLTSLGPIVVGVVSGVAFVLWELRQAAPLLDPRLFRLRGFGTGTASNMVQFFSAFGFFFIALQYLQFVIGLSPLKAALAMLPMAIVVIPLARNAPAISARFGYNKIGSLGLILIAAGFVVISFVSVELNYGLFLAGLVLFGSGMALAGAPATTAITSSLPEAKQGVASAVNDTAREFGSALGIAILGSVLNSAYLSNLGSATSGLPAQAAQAAQSSVAGAQEVATKLGPAGQRLAAAADQAFVDGVSNAVLVAAVLLVLGAAFVFFRAPRQGEQ
ncbi:MAG: MFS transporter [Actinomycetes bacterium]